jgi:hypothetical protein
VPRAAQHLFLGCPGGRFKPSRRCAMLRFLRQRRLQQAARRPHFCSSCVAGGVDFVELELEKRTGDFAVCSANIEPRKMEKGAEPGLGFESRSIKAETERCVGSGELALALSWSCRPAGLTSRDFYPFPRPICEQPQFSGLRQCPTVHGKWRRHSIRPWYLGRLCPL